MKRHVLFDFFGTLVEYSSSRTEQGYERSHRLLVEAGARIGYAEFLDQWSREAMAFEEAAEASRREFSMAQLVAAFLKRIGVGRDGVLIERFTRSYLAEWNKGVRYHERLPMLLDRLAAHHTLGIVTNTHDRRLVDHHLAEMGVRDRFACVVTSVGIGVRKPDPAIFHEALSTIGASPGETLYVGDSHAADYLGARAAGIDCLLIDPQASAPIPSDHRIAGLFDLEARLGSADRRGLVRHDVGP